MEDPDSICDKCAEPCNSDEKNKCKDGTEVCNDCYAEMLASGEESMD